MKQLVIEELTKPGHAFLLPARDRHYLIDVLRMKTGDTFPVLDACGNAFHAVIVRVQPDRVEARTVETAGHSLDPRGPEVTLFQALPKGRKIDDVLRGAVQAGVTRFVPVLTERTIPRRMDDDTVRRERWSRICREAVQQSGATTIPEIDPVTRLADIRPSGGASLFLHTVPLEQASLHGYLDRGPATVDMVVGPEGGFSDLEIQFLLDLGFQPLFLGPRVLRTENAALFALGAVQILLQEKKTWRLTEPATS